MLTKSKPKENREKLFWKSRPNIRIAESDDLKWVKLSASLEGKTVDEAFEANILAALGQYQETMILEDENPRFGQKFGPVGIVAAFSTGHLYQPHVEWFAWATPRNKLRASVAFFQKFRYRELGTVRVHAIEPSLRFFKNLKKYVPLFYVGKVPGGDEWGRGDDFIFYMKCRGGHE